ncbi:hypothetical protein CEXT_293661 [Caerostris extrusa]|uniref:Uncharacterized protein n=1 Tax=Caerostris extrusa TaxID=172846 RepID=A0AAV4VWI3_CAEEX|nr:hypothetical protein CEXT_293661 [Caerostris extrusa]
MKIVIKRFPTEDQQWVCEVKEQQEGAEDASKSDTNTVKNLKTLKSLLKSQLIPLVKVQKPIFQWIIKHFVVKFVTILDPNRRVLDGINYSDKNRKTLTSHPGAESMYGNRMESINKQLQMNFQPSYDFEPNISTRKRQKLATAQNKISMRSCVIFLPSL